jgi:Uma2 family endonuclease
MTTTVALLREFSTQLRRKPCKPATQDIAVKIPRGNVRRPDVLAECGPFDLKATWSVEPKLVAEVLSPSTINLDRVRKLEEYKTVPSLAYIMLVDTTKPQITLYVRDGENWTMQSHDSLDAVIDLPEIGCRLAAIDIFEGLPFAEAGSAVQGD